MNAVGRSRQADCAEAPALLPPTYHVRYVVPSKRTCSTPADSVHHELRPVSSIGLLSSATQDLPSWDLATPVCQKCPSPNRLRPPALMFHIMYWLPSQMTRGTQDPQ